MASRFWVGGTGTWDASTTTHWAASSNGAGGQSVPGSADTVTFDGSSGGGTVTVNTTVTVSSITMGAFTGTLDFSVNNNDVTISSSSGFSGTGTGVRTLKLGNGTWNFTTTATGNATLWNMTTVTNLTFQANSSVLNFSGNGVDSGQKIFAGGGLTYATVQFAANTNGAYWNFSNASTFGTLTFTGRNVISLNVNLTMTTLNLNGTSSGEILVVSSAIGTARTLSVASNAPTMTYCVFRDITCSGGASFVASNSLDFGHNTGITINAPANSNVAAPGLHAIDQGIAA